MKVVQEARVRAIADPRPFLSKLARRFHPNLSLPFFSSSTFLFFFFFIF
jgi:hypothetical protein